MRYLLFILLILLIPISKAASPTYSEVVFFGESSVDNGNLYEMSFHIIPNSPPYFFGRFSDGPLWSDKLADYFQKKDVSSFNYAIGGETILSESYFYKHIYYHLQDSIDKYNSGQASKNKSQTLFIFWVGGNEYTVDTKDNVEVTNKVILKLKDILEELIRSGGSNFLIINQPDLSTTPKGLKSKDPVKLHDLTLLHNKKLKELITDLRVKHKNINIQIYDVYSLIKRLIKNTNFYNKKYGTQLKDYTTPCWDGGYSFEDMKNNYLDKEKQATICNNPKEHIFWDEEHFSKDVHTVLYNEIRDYINRNFNRKKK